MYSAEVIQAIEDRINEYTNAIESGTGRLPECGVCESVDDECLSCPLNHMEADRACLGCMTTQRRVMSSRIAMRKRLPVFRLEGRRKELIDHMEKVCGR